MALSEDTVFDHADFETWEYPVAASTTIYEGSIVCVNSGGYAVPGADTSGYVFAGIAREGADNSDGSAGDINVKVYTRGRTRLKGTSFVRDRVGRVAYVRDSDSFYAYHSSSGSTPKATNNVRLGTTVGYISAMEAWVAFDSPDL